MVYGNGLENRRAARHRGFESPLLREGRGRSACSGTGFGDFGAVSEWFKVTVSKTVVPQGTGGSNPPCSASVWSGDRVVEGGSPLRSYTPKGYRGFESPLLRVGGKAACPAVLFVRL